mmetsp:Transcript_8330/g.24938  ORF Transcript_8330/g.24938 Transcript_8330/m.24938 type:complete len:201 (+) Transcript_8330:5172-5774(+)
MRHVPWGCKQARTSEAGGFSGVLQCAVDLVCQYCKPRLVGSAKSPYSIYRSHQTPIFPAGGQGNALSATWQVLEELEPPRIQSEVSQVIAPLCGSRCSDELPLLGAARQCINRCCPQVCYTAPPPKRHQRNTSAGGCQCLICPADFSGGLCRDLRVDPLQGGPTRRHPLCLAGSQGKPLQPCQTQYRRHAYERYVRAALR